MYHTRRKEDKKKMALQDLIESTYITKWKKDESNKEKRQRILLKDIHATEDFQIINDAARASADACASGYFKMSPQEKQAFIRKHQFNLIVSENGDGTYRLLTGLISYMALTTIFEKKETAFYRKKERNQAQEEWKEPKVRAFIVSSPSRADFISTCRRMYEITFNADIGYIVEEEYQIDTYKMEKEYQKMIEDSSYQSVIRVTPLNGRLYILDNAEGYLAAKEAKRERIRVLISNHDEAPKASIEEEIQIIF